MTQYYITYNQRKKIFQKLGESMILLRYCKLSNKERKIMGYMQTLITHIHCVCFLVGVSDYRSHTSILIFLISFCFFFHAVTSGFQQFLNDLTWNSKKSSYSLSYWLWVLQPVSYFETFRCFTKLSIHHKWNDVRFLLINMVCTSCLTSCWTT